MFIIFNKNTIIIQFVIQNKQFLKWRLGVQGMLFESVRYNGEKFSF